MICIKVPWVIVASCSLKYKLIYTTAHCIYLSDRYMNSLSTQIISISLKKNH